MAHRDCLEEDFLNHPPACAREAGVAIERLTGIKRSDTKELASLIPRNFQTFD